MYFTSMERRYNIEVSKYTVACHQRVGVIIFITSLVHLSICTYILITSLPHDTSDADQLVIYTGRARR